MTSPPSITVPGLDARANLKASRHRRWAMVALAYNKGDLIIPEIRPECRFERDAGVFAIGSCFARGIEDFLDELGVNVLSRAPELDGFEVASKAFRPRGAMNIYNSYSIRHQLEWALVPGAGQPESALIEVTDGGFADLHGFPALKYVSLDATKERRRIIDGVFARSAHADAVVVTLGVNEVWLDNHTGLHMNRTPPFALLGEHPGRFDVRVLSVGENLENLERIHQLLAAHGHPDHQVVVTVSPIPLGATFTEQSIAIANAHSKATLRVAVAEFARRHANVHYFPSYEIVTESRAAQVWMPDRRHVMPRIQRTIAELFVRHYFATESA